MIWHWDTGVLHEIRIGLAESMDWIRRIGGDIDCHVPWTQVAGIGKLGRLLSFVTISYGSREVKSRSD